MVTDITILIISFFLPTTDQLVSILEKLIAFQLILFLYKVDSTFVSLRGQSCDCCLPLHCIVVVVYRSTALWLLSTAPPHFFLDFYWSFVALEFRMTFVTKPQIRLGFITS